MTWTYVPIATSNRTIVDMDETGAMRPILDANQPRAGHTVYHWMNRVAAAAWLKVARDLLAKIRTFEASLPPYIGLANIGNALSDLPAYLPSAGQTLATQDIVTGAQFDALLSTTDAETIRSVFGALMNFYNALNVPWYVHPEARNIYRQFMAGPPYYGLRGGFASKFSDTSNYSYYEKAHPGDWRWGWFRPLAPGDWTRRPHELAGGYVYPLSSGAPATPGSAEVGDTFRGIIPQYGRKLFLDNYPHGRPVALGHPSAFIPWIDLDLMPVAGENSLARVAYQQNVYNAVYPIPPVLLGNQAPTNASHADASASSGMTNCLLVPSGAPCGGNKTAWNAFQFEVGAASPTGDWFGANALMMATPAQSYLAWADAWIAAITDETIDDIIVDVHAYVAYVNKMQNDQSANFVQDALTKDASHVAVEHGRDPIMEAVGAGVAGVGGALAPFTFGVSAIIGGAVGLFTTMLDATLPKPDPNGMRDDLGRLKPTFERAWLGGNPRSGANEDSPQFTVPDAPTLRPRPPPLTGVNWDAVANYTAQLGSLGITVPVAQVGVGDRTSGANGELATDTVSEPAGHPILGAAIGLALGLGIGYAFMERGHKP